jgi:hypothetical protein
VLIGTPNNIQFLVDKCSSFAHIKGFKWNASKSVLLSHPSLTTPLLLDSSLIPQTFSFSYLGIPFSAPYKLDPSLLTQKNANRALGATHSIAHLGFRSSQFPPAFIRHLYLTFVRPCSEYGLDITLFRSTIDLPQLDKDHNSCLRILFESPAASPPGHSTIVSPKITFFCFFPFGFYLFHENIDFNHITHIYS